MEKTYNIVVTVSGQMASGGTYISHSVARRLGVKCVDAATAWNAMLAREE